MKTLGFITTQETLSQIQAAADQASLAQGQIPCLAFIGVPFIAGHEHEGKVFVEFSDGLALQKIRKGVRLKDFPEFPALVGLLGGLDARVEVDPSELVDPDAPEL